MNSPYKILNKSLIKVTSYSAAGMSLMLSALLVLMAQSAVAQSNESPVASVLPAASLAQDAVNVQNFDWQDTVRNRAVPVRLYLPDEALSSTKPVPLIVFSHGLGGSRNGYQYLGRYWASHGYASLHVQHIGSDNSLWRGNPFGLTYRLTQAAKDIEAIDRKSVV